MLEYLKVKIKKFIKKKLNVFKINEKKLYVFKINETLERFEKGSWHSMH